MSNDGITHANVALLRGINVGGKNKLPMADLAAMFREAGCSDVRTYIQSGNVVFRAGPALAGDIPSLISASIMDQFGYRVPVVTRTASEFQEIVQANPFAETGSEANKLHVMFLADLPDVRTLTRLTRIARPATSSRCWGARSSSTVRTGLPAASSRMPTSTPPSRPPAHPETGERWESSSRWSTRPPESRRSRHPPQRTPS